MPGIKLRNGQISSFDARTMSGRVAFDDRDGKVGGQMPLLVRHSAGVQEVGSLPEGTHVVCLVVENGLAGEGVILGTHYTAGNLPEEADPGVVGVTFPDGSRVTFNKETGELNVKAVTSVTVESPLITAKGNLVVEGNITASGSIMAAGASDNHHTH